MKKWLGIGFRFIRKRFDSDNFFKTIALILLPLAPFVVKFGFNAMNIICRPFGVSPLIWSELWTKKFEIPIYPYIHSALCWVVVWIFCIIGYIFVDTIIISIKIYKKDKRLRRIFGPKEMS